MFNNSSRGRPSSRETFSSPECANVIDLTQDDAVRATTAKMAAIDLDEDEDEDLTQVPGFYTISDDDDEADGSDSVDEVLIASERHRLDATYTRRSATPAFPTRDQQLNSAWTELGCNVRPGDGFDVSEAFEGGFFRILQIVKHGLTDEVTVKGIRCFRTKNCKGSLPRKWNEVYAVVRAPADVEDPKIDSYLECLPLHALELPRRIILSNIPFGGYNKFDHSFRHNPDIHIKYAGLTQEARYNRICEEEQVVGRWVSVEYVNAAGKLINKGKIRQLTEEEADDGMKMSDVLKTFMFRGEEATRASVPGQSPKAQTPKKSTGKGKEPVFDLTGSDDDVLQSARKRKRGAHVVPRWPHAPAATVNPHTYGEFCVGAGGVLQAAIRIFGERNVRYVLDHWDLAIATVKRNWPELNALLEDIHGFCTDPKYRLFAVVDVLHASLPCQNDSPANTWQEKAKNFGLNEATKLSIIPTLELAKPRVCTMEQTSGMITHHPDNFRAMVHQFTCMNYSVSWEVISADNLGGPQKRKRLILYASCPGEPLPNMPKPTHGIGPGLTPYTTVEDCLRRVPANVEPHMRQHSRFEGTRPGVDRHAPLKAAITCSGGTQDVHPNGTRGHQMIELAMYQDFRPWHKFAVTGITNLKKLIGNAVPRCLARAWFEEVEKSLNRRDKVIAAWTPEVIEIDSDDELGI